MLNYAEKLSDDRKMRGDPVLFDDLPQVRLLENRRLGWAETVVDTGDHLNEFAEVIDIGGRKITFRDRGIDKWDGGVNFCATVRGKAASNF